MKTDAKFEFGGKQTAAFGRLRSPQISEPVLKLYNLKLQNEIHIDAAKCEFGAVLLQRDPINSLFHPVQFVSRKTTSFEEK